MSENALPKIKSEIMRNLNVELALVFGSRADGTAHAGSDTDIGIVFHDESKKKENPVDVYSALLDEFRHAFTTENIDIVYLKETPLSLQYMAVENGRALYQRTESSLADYKEDVLKKYFDFKFFEDIFNQAIISRQ